LKARRIQERLESIDKSLASAEAYVEKGVNVRSTSWLHLGDWKGRSGHPKWMKNHMLPQTRMAGDILEKTLERMAAREKDRRSQKRRPS
jgi:hypothetical protein